MGTLRGHARPRDAQRRRVYLAETPLPSSPLPGLDACARFVDRVVGTLWWHERFPDRDLGAVPRLRPGNGARQAFFRDEDDGPTITLPRRYRTKGVVLHELVHWALGHRLRAPRTTAARSPACSSTPPTSSAAPSARRARGVVPEQRVHVGKPPTLGPDGRLRYGWDERLRLGRAGCSPCRTAPTASPRADRPVRGLRARRVVLRFVVLDGDFARSRRRRSGRCAMSAAHSSTRSSLDRACAPADRVTT